MIEVKSIKDHVCVLNLVEGYSSNCFLEGCVNIESSSNDKKKKEIRKRDRDDHDLTLICEKRK